MGKQDRFTDEFKRDAVAQVVDRGYPRGKISGVRRKQHRSEIAVIKGGIDPVKPLSD